MEANTQAGQKQCKPEMDSQSPERNDDETWEQKIDRRGNEIADTWAAEGRKEHDLTKQLTFALKKAETTTLEYHKCTAYAAYSQHNGPIEPDHDIRKGPKPPRKKRAAKKPPLTTRSSSTECYLPRGLLASANGKGHKRILAAHHLGAATTQPGV